MTGTRRASDGDVARAVARASQRRRLRRAVQRGEEPGRSGVAQQPETLHEPEGREEQVAEGAARRQARRDGDRRHAAARRALEKLAAARYGPEGGLPACAAANALSDSSVLPE